MARFLCHRVHTLSTLHYDKQTTYHTGFISSMKNVFCMWPSIQHTGCKKIYYDKNCNFSKTT